MYILVNGFILFFSTEFNVSFFCYNGVDTKYTTCL